MNIGKTQYKNNIRVTLVMFWAKPLILPETVPRLDVSEPRLDTGTLI